MNSASTERDAPDIKNVDVLLLDIEGTICSVSFVKDVLFPYAQNNYREHFKRHWSLITKQDLESIEILVTLA
uniref:Enolase-phosphatase E1 n=1 Tax=Romanomermis culicivorax TaxID=13658 RepID=A0A915HGN0_ROMCU